MTKGEVRKLRAAELRLIASRTREPERERKISPLQTSSKKASVTGASESRPIDKAATRRGGDPGWSWSLAAIGVVTARVT